MFYVCGIDASECDRHELDLALSPDCSASDWVGGPFYFSLLFILLRKLASPFSFGLTPTVGFRLVLCSSGPQEAHESELSLSVTWTEDDGIEGSAA